MRPPGDDRSGPELKRNQLATNAPPTFRHRLLTFAERITTTHTKGLQMIDTATETLLTPDEARRQIPGRKGKQLDLCTLYRWMQRGRKGVRRNTFACPGSSTRARRHLPDSSSASPRPKSRKDRGRQEGRQADRPFPRRRPPDNRQRGRRPPTEPGPPARIVPTPHGPGNKLMHVQQGAKRVDRGRRGRKRGNGPESD